MVATFVSHRKCRRKVSTDSTSHKNYNPRFWKQPLKLNLQEDPYRPYSTQPHLQSESLQQYHSSRHAGTAPWSYLKMLMISSSLHQHLQTFSQVHCLKHKLPQAHQSSNMYVWWPHTPTVAESEILGLLQGAHQHLCSSFLNPFRSRSRPCKLEGSGGRCRWCRWWEWQHRSACQVRFLQTAAHHLRRLENAGSCALNLSPCPPNSLRLYDGACRELIGNPLEFAAPQSQLTPRKPICQRRVDYVGRMFILFCTLLLFETTIT